MSSIDLSTLTISEARNLIVKGDITARELAETTLNEIKNKDGDVNSFIEVYEDFLEQADEIDRKIKENPEEMKKLPLLGITFSLKDNFLVEGKKASAGSKILEGYTAPYSATSVEKLKQAGAVLVGRTNMDEFAMGSSTENSSYFVTKNPHDNSRVSGGSSGGSAAAVSINASLGALGSDTGGSVRQPASFCGVVGLKPTYGAISRYGLMAMGSSLDVVGQFAKTVEDAEIIFNVLKGGDKFDGTSYYPEQKNSGSLNTNSKKTKKIGVIKGLMDIGGIDPAVKENYEEIISKLKVEGYEIVEVEMPYINLSLAVYYIIMPAEVSSNLARFDGMKYGFLKPDDNLLGDYLETRGEGFGKEVRRRVILGTYVLSSGYHDAYYGKANQVRDILRNDFNKAFENVEAILTPTAPTPAFKIGEKSSDPLSMYLADIFTVPANLTKGPAISIPSGFAEVDGKKLPLGVQLTAPHFSEDVLFEIGKVIEKIRYN